MFRSFLVPSHGNFAFEKNLGRRANLRPRWFADFSQKEKTLL